MPFDPDMIRRSHCTGVSVAGRSHWLYQSYLPQGDCQELLKTVNDDDEVASAPGARAASCAELVSTADAETQLAAASASATTSPTELRHPEAGVHPRIAISGLA